MPQKNGRNWVQRFWQRLFPGRNPGFWWRSLVATMAWTVVLMIVGALTDDEGWAHGVYEMGLTGLLVWVCCMFLTARSHKRLDWQYYLVYSGMFAWIIGGSVIFDVSVGTSVSL